MKLKNYTTYRRQINCPLNDPVVILIIDYMDYNFMQLDIINDIHIINFILEHIKNVVNFINVEPIANIKYYQWPYIHCGLVENLVISFPSS